LEQIRYEAPRSIGEVVQLLKSGNGADARVLAGGTDLLVQMHLGLRSPGLVVDVKRVPELISTALDDRELRLGASVCAAEIVENKQIGELYPGLVEASDLIGSTQIQGRASIGGNLCNGSPAADTVPALIVLGAEAVVAGPAGQRTVPVESFVTGPGETVLQDGELVVEFRIARPAQRSADAYLRFIPRTEMDIAVVGVGVSLTLDRDGTCTAARVALGAVGPTQIVVPEAAEALIGTQIDEQALQRAADASSAAANPIDDKRGTVAFRRKVSGVLTRRSAAIAAERARERS
jgi:carbon-monoxide dehydrogenase medium subunit